MSIETWLMFCVTEAVLCFTPGTSRAARGVDRAEPADRGRGLRRVCRHSRGERNVIRDLGDQPWGAAARDSAELFTIVKWAGAAYLIWCWPSGMVFESASLKRTSGCLMQPVSLISPSGCGSAAFSARLPHAGREPEGARVLFGDSSAIRRSARPGRCAVADSRRQLDGDRARCPRSLRSRLSAGS